MADMIGRTKHGELTLDQIASMMPGMAELMAIIGQRYQVMCHAGRAENWRLATYQLVAIRKLFNTSKLTRPKYAEAMDLFSKEYLGPIDDAIRARDKKRFEICIQSAVDASDRFHREWGYDYIRFRISRQAPPGYDL